MTPKTALLSILIAMLASLPVLGQGTLDDAWREYEYQNFPTSERLFTQLLKGSAAGSDDQIQARIGLAMLTHYRMPGGNPKKAISMYQDVISALDSSHAFFPTLLVSQGKAFMGLGTPDTGAARQCFATVMRRYPQTVEADQAALELAHLLMYVQDEAHFRQALIFVNDYLARYPDNILSGTMLGICTRVNLFLRDYPAAQQSLIRLYESGKITNMYEVPTILFQIAWISESKLRDYEAAKKYYRLIIDNHSIDSRLYVCELRYQALEEMTREKK